MRKPHKRITDIKLIEEILRQVHVGHLGTVDRDGWPMVKPLNFVYADWRVYFHCALEGEKLEHIRHEPRVCFEAALPIAYVAGVPENACRAEYLYRSVIIRGRAAVVEERDEKIRALDLLMRKYQPGTAFVPYADEKLVITGIVRIDVEEIVGKEELGKGEVREQALALLESGTPLPAVIG